MIFIRKTVKISCVVSNRKYMKNCILLWDAGLNIKNKRLLFVLHCFVQEEFIFVIISEEYEKANHGI